MSPQRSITEACFFLEEMKSLKGQLLLASAQLVDPNFSRTVVLLVEHDQQGAFGVILNRPSDRTVGDIWDDSEKPNQRINVGGPVQGPLMALHGKAAFAEAEIISGVYLAANRACLDELVRQADTQFRLFSGYAGWGAGQLEYELKQGGWILAQAKEAFVLDFVNDLWKQVGKEVTNTVLGSGARIKHFPSDPSLN